MPAYATTPLSHVSYASNMSAAVIRSVINLQPVMINPRAFPVTTPITRRRCPSTLTKLHSGHSGTAFHQESLLNYALGSEWSKVISPRVPSHSSQQPKDPPRVIDLQLSDTGRP